MTFFVIILITTYIAHRVWNRLTRGPRLGDPECTWCGGTGYMPSWPTSVTCRCRLEPPLDSSNKAI